MGLSILLAGMGIVVYLAFTFGSAGFALLATDPHLAWTWFWQVAAVPIAYAEGILAWLTAFALVLWGYLRLIRRGTRRRLSRSCGTWKLPLPTSGNAAALLATLLETWAVPLRPAHGWRTLLQVRLPLLVERRYEEPEVLYLTAPEALIEIAQKALPQIEVVPTTAQVQATKIRGWLIPPPQEEVNLLTSLQTALPTLCGEGWVLLPRRVPRKGGLETTWAYTWRLYAISQGTRQDRATLAALRATFGEGIVSIPQRQITRAPQWGRRERLAATLTTSSQIARRLAKNTAPARPPQRLKSTSEGEGR